MRRLVYDFVVCMHQNQGFARRSMFDSGLVATVLPARGDSDLMFCLQSYQELKIDRSLVYLSCLQDRVNTQVI